ncbi:MAG: MFS transporter [Firmicutes bacterium]|nr:MFS transporter [Bacillota bacterium]
MVQISRWKALVFIYIYMLVFAIVFQGIPPVFGFIVSHFGISHAQAGALMSLFGLPGIFISIPGGILADVYGAKRVGIASLIIALTGSLMVASGNNFAILLIGRIISGIGALIIAIVAPQMISQRFEKKDIGIAMGIYNTAMPLGTIITLNTFGIIAAGSSWRVPIFLTSVYCFFVLILFIFKYPSLPEEVKSKKGRRLDIKKSLSAVKGVGWPVWLVAAIWMMYNASTISYLSFGSDYYMSVGYDANYAGFLTSLLMIGALIFSTIVGYLTDKFDREEFFIIIGSIILAFAFFLIPRAGISPLLLGIIIGISAPFIPSPVFSLVPKILSPDQMGLGYGILSTCLNIGVLIGPSLIGLSYDKTLNYLLGFNLMVVMLLIAILFAIVFRILSKLKK